MGVDVYDVEPGKQHGSFGTEDEAIERTCLLLAQFGADYATDLEIGYSDGRPKQLASIGFDVR